MRDGQCTLNDMILILTKEQKLISCKRMVELGETDYVGSSLPGRAQSWADCGERFKLAKHSDLHRYE
jgi:hypothetical protein